MNFMDFIKDGLAFVRLVTLLLAAWAWWTRDKPPVPTARPVESPGPSGSPTRGGAPGAQTAAHRAVTARWQQDQGLLAVQRQMLDIAQQCQARSGTPANEPR